MRKGPTGLALLLVIVLALFPGAASAKHKDDKKKGVEVSVMTRNLYLGADLTPAIAATSVSGFVDANGGLLRQVTRTNFPLRAQALADEILTKKPDLVGLQEVARWNTGPPSLAPVFSETKTASTVRYDFLEILLAELNETGENYRAVVVQPEFDFEAPANENGVAGDGSGPTPNAELNGRLTMHDVILARRDAGVKVSNAGSGNFANPLVLNVLGLLPVSVTRGYTHVDANVRKSGPFRFVNTHLEAFDDSTEVPSIRARQANELFSAGGPAVSELPVVLLGDINSDDDTVSADDSQAYAQLTGAGFVERSTADPLSCCVDDPDIASGLPDVFDHQVDHILTNDPKRIKLDKSRVTGRAQINGLFPSDHAGILSRLRFK